MTSRHVAREKSRAFALRVVKSCQYLQGEKQVRILTAIIKTTKSRR